MGVPVAAEHEVDPDQFEPGLPDDGQARVHVIDLLLMDWNASLALGVAGWFEAEVAVPVRVIRTEASFLDGDRAMIPGYRSIHHRDETLFGIGDVAATGRIRILRPADKRGLTFDLRAGASLPAGNTERNPFELGRQGISHQHMFFGTGTFDPIVGAEGSYGSDSLRVRGAAALRSPRYENAAGYRGSTQLTVGLGLDASFGLPTWRFAIEPELFHETTATWAGEPSRNSGRTDLIIGAAASWMPTPTWSLELGIKLPTTVRSRGGQLEMPAVFVLGVTRSVELWSAPTPP